MKEVGASKRIGHLIEGESLLNDGSAFVLFVIFKEMFTREEQRSAGGTVGYLFELVFVALLLGAAFGLVTTLVLALVYRCGTLRTVATACMRFSCLIIPQAPSCVVIDPCNVCLWRVLGVRPWGGNSCISAVLSFVHASFPYGVCGNRHVAVALYWWGCRHTTGQVYVFRPR